MRRFQYETKDWRAKQAAGDEFVFEGFGAIFGQEDRDGDVIERGAFKETLRQSDNKFPLVSDHNLGDMRSRLGVAFAYRRSSGIKVEGHINTGTQKGRDVASDIQHAQKHEQPIGLSFGYEVREDRFDRDDNVRRLKDLKVWEWSLTQIASQPDAQVTDTKHCRGGDLTKTLDRIEQLIERL